MTVGLTVIDVPEPTKVPVVQFPEYQFHTPPVPRLPPLRVNVVAPPGPYGVGTTNRSGRRGQSIYNYLDTGTAGSVAGTFPSDIIGGGGGRRYHI